MWSSPSSAVREANGAVVTNFSLSYYRWRCYNLRIFTQRPPSSPLIRCSTLARILTRSSSAQDNNPETQEEGLGEMAVEEPSEKKPQEDATEENTAAAAATVAELKEVLAARKKKEEGDLVGGVLEEIREIEWPGFGKVVGTTGVVLAIIAGSSIALLTVNTILAEISDRVFSGSGMQDLFVEASDLPLDITKYVNFVRDPAAGVITTFEGTTCDTFEGCRVVELRYEVYVSMAARRIGSIFSAARATWSLLRLAAAHHLGVVPVGEASVFVAVSAVQLSDALEACRYVIDELKASMPIWKINR